MFNIGKHILKQFEALQITSRSFHGNGNVNAVRSSKRKATNKMSAMENLQALKRGERFSNRYTDKYGRRSDKFVPVSKLPAPRYSWDHDLTTSNQHFLLDAVKEHDVSLLEQKSASPLNDDAWQVGEWKRGSRRVGAVGIKLGCQPFWYENGRMGVCTLVQLQDCHVVHYIPKDEYNTKKAATIVGCKNASPFYRNEKYAEFCHKAGVPVKAKCFRFAITENAALKPGTKIDATHFRLGQRVDCVAKSVGYGFQGVIQRWHFASGPSRNAHGWHRRPGSLADRSGRVAKGKKMPGQLGGTYETQRGLRVMRINTKYNVLYLQGKMAGHVNQFVKIQDSSCPKYKPKDTEEQLIMQGPFPQYLPENPEEELPEDIYFDRVFSFDQPTVTYK